MLFRAHWVPHISYSRKDRVGSKKEKSTLGFKYWTCWLCCRSSFSLISICLPWMSTLVYSLEITVLVCVVSNTSSWGTKQSANHTAAWGPWWKPLRNPWLCLVKWNVSFPMLDTSCQHWPMIRGFFIISPVIRVSLQSVQWSGVSLQSVQWSWVSLQSVQW